MKHLGEFEKLLLFALLATDDDADGGALREHIEARTQREVSPGAVYTAMDRLQARGFVASRVTTGEGRRRKYYRLRRAGALALDRAVRELRSVSQGLDDALAQAVAAADAGDPR